MKAPVNLVEMTGIARAMAAVAPALFPKMRKRGAKPAELMALLSATGVSTIGIVYAVIVGLLVYRQFDWTRVYSMLVSTASLFGAILFIIGAVTFTAVSVVAFIVLGIPAASDCPPARYS